MKSSANETLKGIRPPVNWRNFATCLFIGFGMGVFSYMNGIIGSTLTKPSFLLYMNLYNDQGKPTPGSTQRIGATTGVFQAGGVFGIILASWVLDKVGRRRALLYFSAFTCISQAILAASQNIGMFIALRFLSGVACFGYQPIVPLYTSELAPTHLRGLYVGFAGIWAAFGFALSAYIGIAFYDFSNSIQWRMPLGLGAVFALMMAVGVYFIPESPRHLLLHNKAEVALAVEISQHTVKGTDEDFARAEFVQMQKQTDLEKKLDSSWLSFLREPLYRRRLIIIIITVITTQSSGNLVINAYGGILYGSLGYEPYQQLVFQCGYITVALGCSIIGGLLVDRVGRRRLLLTGLGGCVASLIVEAVMVALYAKTGTNKSGLRAGVAAFFVFIAFYATSVDIVCFLVVSELWPNHLRAKGGAWAFCSGAIINLIFLQSAPTALANIGWKYFLVFASVTVAGMVFIYFYLPEATGVPLEELAGKFGIQDEVAIQAEDIHIDHVTHNIFVAESHNVTEAEGRKTGKIVCQDIVEKM